MCEPVSAEFEKCQGLLVPEWLCGNGGEHPYSYPEERKTGGLVIEVMDVFEYHWECLECEVEDAQDECIPAQEYQMMSHVDRVGLHYQMSNKRAIRSNSKSSVDH